MTISAKKAAESFGVPLDEVLAAARICNIEASEQTILSLEQVSQIEKALGSSVSGVPIAEKMTAAKCLLEHYVKSYNYKIFMDTSALMSDYVDAFFGNFLPLLKAYDKKVYVPVRCVEELNKWQDLQESHPDKARKARHGLRNLLQLQEQGLLDLRASENDNFADNVFQTIFSHYRPNYKLLLIADDLGLARDILRLNDTQSSVGHRINVRKISRYGYLAAVQQDQPQSKREQDSREKEDRQCPLGSTPRADEIFRFRRSEGMIPRKEQLLEVTTIPESGDKVFICDEGSWREAVLGEEVGSGGEGIIYAMGENTVAKIYKRESLTDLRRDKIQLYLDHKLTHPGICFPTAMLYNEDRKFVGYLMPRAKGQDLLRSVMGKRLLEKSHPNWKKQDMVRLCISILSMIRYLHDRNILLGDINPANFMVGETPEQACLVDTDSFQIENMPCPMYTVCYTAPELQGKPMDKILRTEGNECFAVATLLFMLMLPGKTPYAKQGGGSQEENIACGDFEYPLGDRGKKNTPDGLYKYMWSHLTYSIKEAFFHTFSRDGDHFSPDKRLSVSQWQKLFGEYYHLLNDGKLQARDQQSGELFPTRHKLNPAVTYKKCVNCGELIDEKTLREGWCKRCLHDGEVRTCQACGEAYIHTNYQKVVRKNERCICKSCMVREWEEKKREPKPAPISKPIPNPKPVPAPKPAPVPKKGPFTRLFDNLFDLFDF